MNRANGRLFQAVLLALLLSACSHATEPGDSRGAIVSESGTHQLTLELATTPEQLGLGLMYREHLPWDHGMLFDMRGRGSPAMWMKNVPISLDMIFMDERGVVVGIIPDTKPDSTDLLYPAAPFSFVLELPAGSVARYRLKEGDRMEHPLFEIGGTHAR